jgi:hypothetical protein
MPDTNTTYELRMAFHQPGCPFCTLVLKNGSRYIETVFSESMLDPGVRQKLVDSLGFCHEHTWRSIDLKLSDALGNAILFHDLVKETLKMVEENEKLPGNQLSKVLEQQVMCPACRIEELTLERIIGSMKKGLCNQDFIAEFKKSSGLCIPHLKRFLPGLDKDQQEIVLNQQLTCMEILQRELSEFIRKSDYRFRDEIIGKEGDSYKRAADLLKGKRRPDTKRDLR